MKTNKKNICVLLFSAFTLLSTAQTGGGISDKLLNELKLRYKETPADRALNNAVAKVGIADISTDNDNLSSFDTYFSDRVPSKGITDQKASGRCWLFTGLNVMRARMIESNSMGDFSFSQNYCFFYDQLEKSNLFLQSMIDNAKKPKDDMLVDWLFRHPLSDGGTFTGVSDLVEKYGLVPASVMPETFNSNNTSRMSSILSQKLCEYGLKLRSLASKGAKTSELTKHKEDMLATIYRILVRFLGNPPSDFVWTRKDASGKPVDTNKYTPKSFYKTFIGKDLNADYVMLMNDPSRDYYKCYEIDLDRHVYDGHNWRYVNLPVDEIKQMAIKSIKDSTMMYFACDVNKFMDSKRGIMDLKNYDYASLLGTDFPMNKSERIQTYISGSSHAMTLMAVDIAENGTPKKWMVENSWGASSGYNGHLIMTDEWFNEYMFRLVVEKKYSSDKVLDVLKQKPILLPAWDPMFSSEE